MQKMKIIHWPKRVMPEPDMHKLENEEYHDTMDVFGGHNEYRPDCITRSAGFRFLDDECESYTFDRDHNAWMDQYAYGLPGDFATNAGW